MKLNQNNQKLTSIKFISLVLLITFILPTNRIVAGTDNPVPKTKWFKYITKEGKSKISFPCKYEIIEEENEDAITIRAQASCGSDMFFFAYTVHKLELTDHYYLAEVALESFNEVLGGTIISQKDFTLNKNKGIIANIRLDNEDINIEYRIILIGQIQYQLIVMDSSKNIEKEKKKFFKSFKVKK